MLAGKWACWRHKRHSGTHGWTTRRYRALASRVDGFDGDAKPITHDLDAQALAIGSVKGYCVGRICNVQAANGKDLCKCITAGNGYS